jgi:hypothetical protein
MNSRKVETMLLSDLPILSNTQRAYFLPTHFAFLKLRWLAFWDVFYYLAHNWQGPWPTPLPTASEGNLAAFSVDANRFSRLLYGLTPDRALSPNQYEAGRKTFRDLSNLACKTGLLYETSEAEDPYLNNYGSQASRYFMLPVYHKAQSFSWPGELPTHILKPCAFIEKGWIGLAGNTYERHLLNLFLLKQALKVEPDPRRLALELMNCYETCYKHLPDVLAEEHEPPQKFEVLQRQIGKALQNLAERGLLEAVVQHFSLGIELPPSTPAPDLEWENRLNQYERKDVRRATRLRALAATGQLKPEELKAAWTTLADFNATVDFDILQGILQRRGSLQEDRVLSWREIEKAARATRSKRGTRPTENPQASFKSPLVYRLRKRNFDSGNETNLDSWQWREPLRPKAEIFINPRRVNRVKLAARVNVAGWRSFARLTTEERPQIQYLILRLLDSNGQVIFEDEPHLIDPVQSESHWNISLTESVRNWLERNTSGQDKMELHLLYLEAERSAATRHFDGSWFTLSLELAFFFRNGRIG